MTASLAPIRGLDRFCRTKKKIVADLDGLGLIERIEPHKAHGAARRSQAMPSSNRLLTDQWFVDIKPLGGRPPFVRSKKAGYVSYPRPGPAVLLRIGCTKSGIGASAASLWWGHRIPAWYDTEGRCYVGPQRSRSAPRRMASMRRCAAAPGTMMCSTPGSQRRCGHSRPWAGRRKNPGTANLLSHVGPW